MKNLLPETTFLTNLYATPADWQRDLFYCVVRAGHLKAGFEHRIQRETYPGHELILCLSGHGWVQVGGKRHEVSPGSLVWVNCHHPHQYGAMAKDPWEVFWVRVEGRQLDRTSQLLDVHAAPVFQQLNTEAAAADFQRAFRYLEGTRPCDAAHVNAAIAAIIAAAFESRLSDPGALQPELPPAVAKSLDVPAEGVSVLPVDVLAWRPDPLMMIIAKRGRGQHGRQQHATQQSHCFNSRWDWVGACKAPVGK